MGCDSPGPRQKTLEKFSNLKTIHVILIALSLRHDTQIEALNLTEVPCLTET